MYVIRTSDDAGKILKKWKKSNPLLFKKYQKLYHELRDHPRLGLGHPEPLVGGDNIRWSRHITAHDRIVYDIHDEEVTVIVIQLESHYNDK